ncbi:MAG: type II toxin-antitoxin system RelE/ParE family toxin [Candidatus Omnitrophota bacterium]
MALYESFYYRNDTGRCPVKEFIDSLDPRSQRKFFYVLSLLEEFGPRLPLPHARYLCDGIFELRFCGSEGNIRALYFFFRHNRIILTNGFIKKTPRAPQKEITVALERRKAFLGEGDKI